MNTPALLQATGNACLGLATLMLLFPLPRLLAKYAALGIQDDRWVTPALFVVIPIWLLLMMALLCMTASGGFAWMRLGGPALYTLTVAASIALATVTFVFIGLYIRPGFTPQGLYAPVIYFAPIVTALLVLSGLNPRIAAALPIHWLRIPWVVFTGISIVISLPFLGYRLVTDGLSGIGRRAAELVSSHIDAPEELASITTLDPRTVYDFNKLLGLAGKYHGPRTREAATARLRELPDFNARLIELLESAGSNNDALDFIESASFTPEEMKLLAGPTRTALEQFIDGIPAPNYMPRDRQKELLKWGRNSFPVIIGKFAGTKVDFSGIMPAFEHALRHRD